MRKIISTILTRDIAQCTLCHDQECKSLECFQDLLQAAQYALANLPNIATSQTISSVAYQETRMKLLLAIEEFEDHA